MDAKDTSKRICTTKPKGWQVSGCPCTVEWLKHHRHQARNCCALPQQMNRSYSSWCLHNYTYKLIINQVRVVNSGDRHGVNLTGESWGQMKAHMRTKDEQGPQMPGPIATCAYT